MIRYSIPLRSALCLLALLPGSANAAPPAPGQREANWNNMRDAPIHLQAEIVTTPIAGFATGGWDTACAADAVARVIFNGQDQLSPGQRFRFKWSCRTGGGAWYIYGRTSTLHPNSAADEVDGLKLGQKIELFLGHCSRLPTSPCLELTDSDGMRHINGFTTAPVIDLNHPPSWYDMTYWPKDHKPTPKQFLLPPASEFPRQYPLRDVSITYVSTDRPGLAFTASYSATMFRSVIYQHDGHFRSSERIVLDPVVGLSIRIWDRRKKYAVEPYHDRLFELSPLNGSFKPTGTLTIAGLPCIDYELQPGVMGNNRNSMSACVTADGIRLRRIENGVTTTATSIAYGAVTAEASIVPEGYLRVPAADDIVLRQRPIPGD